MVSLPRNSLTSPFRERADISLVTTVQIRPAVSLTLKMFDLLNLSAESLYLNCFVSDDRLVKTLVLWRKKVA